MLRVTRLTSLYLILFFLIGGFFYSQYSYSLGTINIVKDTVPPGFGPFSFTLAPSTFFSLSDGDPPFSITDLPTAATYVITETTLPAGFDLMNINCVVQGMGGSMFVVNVMDGNVTIDLEANDVVTCTFVNQGSGTIIIQKITNPTGGAGFGFTNNIPGGPSPFTLNHNQTQTFMNVPADTYTVTENDPAVAPGGFILTDIVCNDMGSTPNVPTRTATIDLDPNEVITCMFTNTIALEDLNITKMDFPDPVVAGEELTYEITVDNGSLLDANSVMLNDMLPEGLILAEISVSRQGIVCMPTIDQMGFLSMVDCNIGNLGSGETVTITIIVIPDPDVFSEMPEIIQNKATLTAEPGSVVRQTTTNTLVNPIVDIEVTPDDSERSVRRGNTFMVDWEIGVIPDQFTALNSIESSSLTPVQRADALGVILDVDFSDLFVVEDVETTQGTCTVGSVQCNLGNILEGQTVIVTITFRAPDESGEFDIVATVTSLAQTFTDIIVIRVTSGGGHGSCSIASVGTSMGFPVYLLIPLLIIARRIIYRARR